MRIMSMLTCATPRLSALCAIIQLCELITGERGSSRSAIKAGQKQENPASAFRVAQVSGECAHGNASKKDISTCKFTKF